MPLIVPARTLLTSASGISRATGLLRLRYRFGANAGAFANRQNSCPVETAV
jgi:hypothetical protein